MYSIAASVVWGALQPSNLIAILAILGLIAAPMGRRLAGRLLGASAILLVLFGLLPLGKIIIAPLEDRFPEPSATDVAAAAGILVLGGAEQAALSELRRQPMLNGAAERLIAGADLAHRFPTKPMLFTSGAGTASGFTQSDVAAMAFTAMGLAPDRVQYETKSANTYENATFTRALIPPSANGPWILVTSAFHMPRAVAVFRKAGWTVLPYPVDYRSASEARFDFTPDVAARLHEADLAVHEWLGLVVYQVLGRSDELFPAPADDEDTTD